MYALLFFMFAVGITFSGCTSVMVKKPSTAPNKGSTSYRAIDDSHMTHYQPAFGDISGATPTRHASPIYPSDQLAVCASIQKVLAQVIVDEAGKVSDVRDMQVAETVSTALNKSFFTAVRTAVLEWEFTPLRISHWSDSTDGRAHEEDATAKPFSLMYVFSFECHAGKATVMSVSTQG